MCKFSDIRVKTLGKSVLILLAFAAVVVPLWILALRANGLEADAWLALLRAALWPVTVLFLALYLGKDVLQKIQTLQELRAGGLQAFFPPPSVNQDIQSESGATGGPGVAAKDLSGQEPTKMFWLWLGHDIMWTIDALYRMSNRNVIIHGLTQIEMNLAAAIPDDTALISHIERLRADVEACIERDLTPPKRQAIVDDLHWVLKRAHDSSREGRSCRDKE